MNELLLWIATRLKEPSTWAGLTGILAVININLDPGWIDQISFWGAIVAGALATGLAEKAKRT